MGKLDWSKAKRNPHGYEALSAPTRADRKALRAAKKALTPWLGDNDPRCEEIVTLRHGVIVDVWRRRR